MKWKHFPYYWELYAINPLGDQWIPLKKDLQCGTLICALLLLEQAVEQTIKLQLICNVMVLMWGDFSGSGARYIIKKRKSHVYRITL